MTEKTEYSVIYADGIFNTYDYKDDAETELGLHKDKYPEARLVQRTVTLEYGEWEDA